MFDMSTKLENILEEMLNSGCSSEAAVADHIKTVAENGDGQDELDFLANEALEVMGHAAWLASYLCPEVALTVKTREYQQLADILMRSKGTFIITEFSGDEATIVTTNEIAYAFAKNFIDRTTRQVWLLVEYGEGIGEREDEHELTENAVALGFVSEAEAKAARAELYEYFHNYPLKESWVARHFKVTMADNTKAQTFIQAFKLDQEDENGFNKIRFDCLDFTLIEPMAEKAADR